MLGLPACGTKGCPWPGVAKFTFTEGVEEIFVHLCPFCFPRATELHDEVENVRRQILLEQKASDGQKT